MNKRYVEVRSLLAPELRQRAEQIIAATSAKARLEMGGPVPPAPNPRRLLCGCVDTEPPSLARKDGSCRACSP
jgi:hypothetical protein